MLAPSEFEAADARGYLDTATYGLPPRSAVEAVERALAGWRRREPWRQWEDDGEACRVGRVNLIRWDDGRSIGDWIEDEVALAALLDAGLGLPRVSS